MPEMINRPLVGVFVNDRFRSHPKGIHFAAKLMQANEVAGCVIYFFSPRDIDWGKRRVNGSIFNHRSGQWAHRPLPFPDVLYDRGTLFPQKQQVLIEDIRRRFKMLSRIRFINSGKLEKWLLHRQLHRFQELRTYLPETILFRHFDDLEKMLFRFGYVFIKSSSGSGGTEVLSVEKLAQCHCLRFYRGGAHRYVVADSWSELKTILSAIIGTKPKEMIIQQGIRLIKYRGRLLDLRVLLLKNKSGQWVSVYNQARIAKKEVVITNASLGADILNYHDLYLELKAVCPHLPDDEQIREISIVIARYIEKQFGLFGEIGMDMAVDESGKVWFLEGNSKPSKLPEEIEENEGISPQFLMILEYARFLNQSAVKAGQNKRGVLG